MAYDTAKLRSLAGSTLIYSDYLTCILAALEIDSGICVSDDTACMVSVDNVVESDVNIVGTILKGSSLGSKTGDTSDMEGSGLCICMDSLDRTGSIEVLDSTVDLTEYTYVGELRIIS